jgi:MFS family permease
METTVKASSLKAESGTAAQPRLGYAWYVVLVLVVCYTLSFIDRQILSLLVGPMKRDLGLSDTRVGLLQGLAFALFYTIMGLPLGRLADTKNRRNLITIGIAFWSVMTMLCSAARSFGTLFLSRIGVGVGEATLSPGAFSIITDYFPRERLGRALSLYSMGIFIGSGLALIVGGSVVQMTAKMPAIDVPILGMIASWRFTFLIVGVPGLLIALWALTIKEPLRKNLLMNKDGAPSRLSTAQVIEQIRVRWQSIFGISFGMVFQSMCTFAFTAWGPAFFQRIHHWTPAQTGRTLGVIVITCGCLGMYTGGVLADRWAKAGIREGHLRPGVISGVGVLVFFVAAFLQTNPWMTAALLAPGIFCLGLPMGNSYAALQLILPNQVRGQVSALFFFIFNLGGQTMGPLLPGLFNDYLFKSEAMLGPSLALAIGFAAVMTSLVFRSVYSPYRRHSAAMDAAVKAAAV